MGMLTPQGLREHAALPRNIAWEGKARQLLSWSADCLEAAQEIGDLNTQLNIRISELEAKLMESPQPSVEEPAN